MLPLTGIKTKLDTPVKASFTVSCREGINRRHFAGPKESPVEVLKIHPRVWVVVKRLCGKDFGRVEVVSETEIVVHNNADWRKKRGCPRIQP